MNTSTCEPYSVKSCVPLLLLVASLKQDGTPFCEWDLGFYEYLGNYCNVIVNSCLCVSPCNHYKVRTLADEVCLDGRQEVPLNALTHKAGGLGYALQTHFGPTFLGPKPTPGAHGVMPRAPFLDSMACSFYPLLTDLGVST